MIYDAGERARSARRRREEADKGAKHNRAKVGSARPSSLLYTYGPGRSWTCPSLRSCRPAWMTGSRSGSAATDVPTDPRAAAARRGAAALARRTSQLRPFPWQPKKIGHVDRGQRPRHPGAGVSAVAALHRLRHARPAVAVQLHQHPPVPPRPRHVRAREVPRTRPGDRQAQGAPRPAVPARYLSPASTGTSTSSRTSCGCTTGSRARTADSRTEDGRQNRRQGRRGDHPVRVCDQRRRMNEAQGERGRSKLPQCRGRHPHLDAFEPDGCRQRHQADDRRRVEPVVPSTQSIIVMPSRHQGEDQRPRRPDPDWHLGDKLAKYRGHLDMIRDLLETANVDVTGLHRR